MSSSGSSTPRAHTPDPHIPTSNSSSSTTPTTPTPQTPHLQPLRSESLRFILIYTRRPIQTSSPHPVPPILRRLRGLAMYESHIRTLTIQLRGIHPTTSLVQIDVDLGFPFAGLESRLRSWFGDGVQPLIFERVVGGRCTWEGEENVLRDLVRGFKIYVH